VAMDARQSGGAGEWRLRSSSRGKWGSGRVGAGVMRGRQGQLRRGDYIWNPCNGGRCGRQPE